jgi:endonuclease/exonuclease/phosphatase family metal-dependent hydrolase
LFAGDLNVDCNEPPYRLSQNSCLRHIPTVRQELQPTELSEHVLGKDVEQPFIEFNHIIHIFQKHNVVVVNHSLEKYNGHPVSFGDGDRVLTSMGDSTTQQNLDYICTLSFDGKPSHSRLKCRTDSCTVQQFKLQGTKFGQLSDHYGVSIAID